MPNETLREVDRPSHTSVELSAYVYRWVKRRRGETDQSLKAIVNQAMEEFIEREDRKAARLDSNGR